MATPILVAYDIDNKSSSEVTPSVLGYIGSALVKANPDTLIKTADWVDNYSNVIKDIHVECTGLSLECLIKLLDLGASTVSVDWKYVKELSSAIPCNRLACRIELSEATPDIIESLVNSVANIEIISKESEFDVIKLQKLNNIVYKTPLLPTGGARSMLLHLQTVNSLEDLNPLIQVGIIPIIDSSVISLTEGQVCLADLILCKTISDRPDGLLPTTVTDERGFALGFVYSSRESVSEALKRGVGVYQSRKRGIWIKGLTSGATQELIRIEFDCDYDALKFIVRQEGKGFCHLEQSSCFGNYNGLSALEKTLQNRKQNAPEGSYTKRLYTDPELLRSKIMEEAEELCDATEKMHVAFEAADLIYFAMTKCVAAGVSLVDIEKSLDRKSRKITRRKGDAKPKPIAQDQKVNGHCNEKSASTELPFKLRKYNVSECSKDELAKLLERPVQRTSEIMPIVQPIVESVKTRGDAALLEYTEKFEGAKLSSTVINAPFSPSSMIMPSEVKEAIDIAFENIRKFHSAQLPKECTMVVETMPGVECSRFSRPIEKVGLYIPGGTAVLPSTAMMLGVPAMVAGCAEIVFASPPRKDGTITPEIVYIAHKVGAKCIVMAGGAQAVAAMSYGTKSVPKCDKIFGPGNQFVTAAKMYVSNDTSALVGIDMPAGPSEVLVIADGTADPVFVASDLLSQAEHGADSMSVLVAIGLSDEQVNAVDKAVEDIASSLPRADILRKSISHSLTLRVENIEQACEVSNMFAPEHLIMYFENAREHLSKIKNAGSIFVGPYSPVACGDYASGTNHTLPTYGFAKMYSGVSTSSFQKQITSQELSLQGLQNVGPSVMALAKCEGLEAHRQSVELRLK